MHFKKEPEGWVGYGAEAREDSRRRLGFWPEVLRLWPWDSPGGLGQGLKFQVWSHAGLSWSTNSSTSWLGVFDA